MRRTNLELSELYGEANMYSVSDGGADAQVEGASEKNAGVKNAENGDG